MSSSTPWPVDLAVALRPAPGHPGVLDAAGKRERKIRQLKFPQCTHMHFRVEPQSAREAS
jgi:hypothetical protein